MTLPARRIRFDNIRAVSPGQETTALCLIETLRSTEQRSRLDHIDQWVLRVMCDLLREDGVLPGGKPPP